MLPDLLRALFFEPAAVLPTFLPVVFARAVLLPLLLALAVVLGLGSYFETSDDGTLAWLFSGVLALKPLTSVPLYLHGYGHLLAAAYTAWPAGPWLGLLLAGLLAAATALWFAVLERLLRPHLRPDWLTLVLALFFGLAWLEHWLWFSHGRVALLLAGAGVLFAAQRSGRRGALLLGLVALGAAWLVRPGLAVLGAGAVAPAALLLAGGWRRAAPVLASVGLGLLLAMGLLHWRQTPAEARTQRRDAFFARVLDFNQLRPRPRTAADSLGTAAIGLWLLGDSTVVNENLAHRAYHFDAAGFLGREVPAKLRRRAGQLGRDYFPLLLALAATAVVAGRHRGRPGWFWLVQLGYGGGLLLLAGLFKLPPRLALPLLDFWLLTNLVIWLRALQPSGSLEASAEVDVPFKSPGYHSARLSAGEGPGGQSSRPNLPPLARNCGAAAILLIAGLYAAKTGHRYRVLHQERRQHESALAAISREAGRVRVLAGTNDLLKSLSPFRTYYPGPGPVLLLTGWSAHDASQARLRQALTGTPDQTECLRRLARRVGPDSVVLWFLTPETARWLNRRSRFNGLGSPLVPETLAPLAGSVFPLQGYGVQFRLKP